MCGFLLLLEASSPLSTRAWLCAELWGRTAGWFLSPSLAVPFNASPYLQRLCQLIIPDPSLPQPRRPLHLDNGPGQDCRPFPQKEGLISGEKETEL